MKRLLFGAIAGLILGVAALAGLIAFGTASPPPPLKSLIGPYRNVDFSDVPAATTIPMRDGLPLSVHVYKAAAQSRERVAIAIHGSSAFGASLHPLSKALRDAGFTVYAPDLRGHGSSGRRGDIDYVGQLDDDLADLTKAARDAHPNADFYLLGFSSGGGFALHAAALPVGASFVRTVLISPMLGVNAPTTKDSVYTWARPYIPRIVGLTILDRFGVRTFDGLPVIAFAVPDDPKEAKFLAPFYSFRLLTSFGTRDYVGDLRGARSPIAVVIGADDELFDASQAAATIRAENPKASVTVVPGIGHAAMTLDPRAIDAIIAAITDSQRP